MTNFLTRLVERAVGNNPAIEPIILPIFATGRTAWGAVSITAESVDETGRKGEHLARREPIPAVPAMQSDFGERIPPSSTQHQYQSGLQQTVQETSDEGEAPSRKPLLDNPETLDATKSSHSRGFQRESCERKPEATMPTALLAPRVIHPVVVSQRLQQESNPVGHREYRTSAAPTIQVTIGRIDVRAVLPAAPPPRKTMPPRPALTLDDYLRERNYRRR
jgi:hypothetical protein